MGSLLDPAGASVSPHPPVSSSVASSASPPLSLSHPPACASPLFSLPAGLELHIIEDGGDGARSLPRQNQSPVSSLSAASDPDLDSAPVLAQTKSLLVLSRSSNSSLMRNSPSPSNTTTTPSLTSVNTVLDHKSSKSPSPSVDRASPSHPVPKFSCVPVNQGSSFHDLGLSFSPPPALKKTPPPFPLSASPRSSSPTPASPAPPPPLVVLASSLPVAEPSLDEALDKLLAMSFTQNHTAAQVEEDDRMEARCVGRGMQEVQEELVLPVDRSGVLPDMFSSAADTITDESVDGGTDGNGDLDWADEELSVSFHDGLDGTMTPYTERPYTDGSMTPLTEASWMDESMTPSSCPGTPEAALDLPLLQTPGVDRVSASGHVRPPPCVVHAWL